ncbi:MAG: hypothetical protein NVV59_13705 [Chitinophagaceae bacterium]|nr:hypothetical protein [Chitinophagaceae bacterium]
MKTQKMPGKITFCPVVFHLETARCIPHLYTMMCGMNSRGLLGLMMSCLMLWSATAEAQRGSEMDNNFIYLPDAYAGEREILISGGCHAAAVGGVSAPHFFLSAARPCMIRGWNLFPAALQHRSRMAVAQLTCFLKVLKDIAC